MRHAWILAALAATGLLAAGAAAPAALAADDCPNAAVRAQQGVQHLPLCMAYEKLTPTNKNGASIGAELLMSDDGTQTWIYAAASIIDGTPSGSTDELLATRGTDGWTLESLLSFPQHSLLRNMGPADYPQVFGFQGMRRVLFASITPLDPGDVGGGTGMQSNDLYLREEDGTVRWLTQPEGFTYATHDPAARIDLIKAAPDLSTVIFGGPRVMNRSIDPTERTHIWVWRDGKPYEMIDYLPDGSPSTETNIVDVGPGNPRLFGSSTYVTPDFSTVVWMTRVRVGRNNVDHLYVRTGVGTPQARTLAVSETADGSTSCSTTEGFEGLTLDGRYVRFKCGAKLTDDAPTTGGYYVKDTRTGDVIYDVPKVDRGPTTTDTVNGWTRPDGTYRVENRYARGIWTVHIPTGEEKCATCFGDTVAQGRVLGGQGGVATGGLGDLQVGFSDRNFVTPDGDVYFVTSEQLVPEDTNAGRDLYIAVDGEPYLLSGGDAARDIQMGGVSLDGSTASFMTTSALLAEDQDGGGPDVYVVRRNGGFFREAQPAPCSAGCQGPAILPTAPLAPLSTGIPGGGNLEDDATDDGATPIAISGSRAVRGTSLRVKVRTPAAGRVTASGNGLRKTSRSVKKASSATLTVKLSARSQRLLRTRSSVKVKATIRFVPARGQSQSKRVNLTFRQAKKTTSKKGASRSVAAASSGKAAR